MLFVLHLPALVPGIDYRAYADASSGGSVLGWLAPRLTKTTDSGSLVVLCHSNRDRELSERLMAGSGVWVFRSPLTSKLEALTDLVSVIGADSVACFRTEIAFAPSDILPRATSFHAATANDFTAVDGLPSWTCPEIFSLDILAKLLSLGGPPSDPGVALRRIATMRPDQVKAAPFRVSEYYPDPFECSDPVCLVTATDAKRAWITLAGLPDSYSFDALRRWSETRVDAPLPELETPKSSAEPELQVLFVSAAGGYSGAEESMSLMVSGLSSEPFGRYALIGADGLLAEKIRQSGSAVVTPNWDFLDDNADAARLARHVLDWSRPDVIHTNTAIGPGLAREAQRRGIPIIAHIRVAKFERLGSLLDEATVLIAISDFVRKRLLHSGVTEEKLRVVYNGIDCESFRPDVFAKAAMRARFHLPQNAFVVLMVARMDPSKRHDLLLEAARQIRADIPGLHVVFVGDLQLTESGVTVLPFQHDIRQIECASDLIVLPSDHEPLGRCVLEAMALEIPTVVSDNGGSAELVEHEVTGLHFQAGDPASLGASILRVAHDLSQARRLAGAGRQRAIERFSMDEHTRRIAQLYRELKIRR